MGAWGSGPFDNDDASDWIIDLDGADAGVVRAALVVSPSDVYLEAPTAAVAIAAAEVVAAAVRTGRRDLPGEVTGWVAAHRAEFHGRDVSAAVAAVERVVRPQSELVDLWLEAGDPTWRREVEDLLNRLRG